MATSLNCDLGRVGVRVSPDSRLYALWILVLALGIFVKDALFALVKPRRRYR
jgi:hypothetical protein